jgi:hypothetical protein
VILGNAIVASTGSLGRILPFCGVHLSKVIILSTPRASEWSPHSEIGATESLKKVEDLCLCLICANA